MIKRVLSIILFLSILSCSSYQNNFTLHGMYISERVGFFKRNLGSFQGKVYPLGESLILNADSSFNFLSCAQSFEGTWSYQTDSIYLLCSTYAFIDSEQNPIDSTRKDCNEVLYVFHVNKKHLKTTFPFNGKTAVVKLKKEGL